jgi:ABC-2 type transport system ATP-binding protein
VSSLYSPTDGVQAADFELGPGDLAALIGKNGAGKTTLIRCLSGLLEYHGRIELDGRKPNSSAYRKNLAFLPDDTGLPDWLCARELAQWTEKLWQENGFTERFERNILEFFPDLSVLQKPMHSCSRGMKQRVGLSLCLARTAQLYLLDEPDSYLDALSKKTLVRLLNERKRQGGIVLFATHDAEIAFQPGNILFEIDQGTLRENLDHSPETELVAQLEAENV